MKSPIIPESYEQWRHCIVTECGIELTQSYIDKTMLVLQNNKEHYTQQFIKKYGSHHHQRVLGWFLKAKEMS